MEQWPCPPSSLFGTASKNKQLSQGNPDAASCFSSTSLCQCRICHTYSENVMHELHASGQLKTLWITSIFECGVLLLLLHIIWAWIKWVMFLFGDTPPSLCSGILDMILAKSANKTVLTYFFVCLVSSTAGTQTQLTSIKSMLCTAEIQIFDLHTEHFWYLCTHLPLSLMKVYFVTIYQSG